MDKTTCKCPECGGKFTDMLEVKKQVVEESRREEREVIDHCCPHCKAVLASDDQITGFIKT